MGEHAGPTRAAPAQTPRARKAAPRTDAAAVRQVLHRPRVQRQNRPASTPEDPYAEAMRYYDIWKGKRPAVDPDKEQFPLATSDASRGFRSADLARLSAAGVALSFAGSLAPLPADAQKILLDNIAETVRFSLDPNHPDRVIELEALRLQYEAEGHPERFFDRPADRIDATDLYHGHICVPQSVLNGSTTLQKLRDSAYSGFGTGTSIDDDRRTAIGNTMPTTRPEARKMLAVANRHREPFLKQLTAMMAALATELKAGVMYHSRETDKPLVGKVRLPSDHPVRHIFTPFSTHRPEFRQSTNRDCATLLNFSFHVDRRGRITLLPGSSAEMVHAVEILNGWGTAP